MGVVRVLPVLACAGCAQLLGIDNTSGAMPDAPPPTPMVSLAIDRLSIGASIVRAPQALDPPLMATYLVPDATDPTLLDTVPAMQSGNTWSAAIATGTPAVEFTLPDTPTSLERQWSFARTMYGLFGQLEHPNKAPAPSPATIHTQLTLPSAYVAGESFQVYVVGTWATHGYLSTELPTPGLGGTTINATLAYDTGANHFSNAITGRALDAITTDDAVTVLRYSGNNLTGQLVASFAQTGADTVSGTMIAVAQSSTLDVTIAPTMPQTRFAAVRPAVSAIQMGWDLRAAPGYLYANNNGPLLAAAGLAPTSAAHITQTYGNPFVARGWKEIFNWNNYETRTVTVAGPNLPTTLYAGLQQLALPAAGLTLSLPAPLPVTISLDSVALTTDNLSVQLDATKPATVSFVADQPNDTYNNVQVYELVPNTATMPTALVYQFRYSASGFGTSFQIPAGVMQVGHYYTLRANCIMGGYPAIASGDLTQRDLPFAQGYADSGVFTVTQ